MNTKLFLWLHQGAGQQPIQDILAVFFAEGGPYILMLTLVVCWLLVRGQRRLALLEATEASLLGLLINQVVGLVIYHPRPYMIGLCNPLIAHGPENSFPSDHVTLILAVSLSLLLRRGWRGVGLALLATAVATGWGRIYAGIHFPLDMVGSLLVALSASGILLWQRKLVTPLNEQLVKTYHRLAMYLLNRLRSS